MPTTAIRILVAFALGGIVTACEREAPVVREQVRAIRAIQVTEVASGRERSFSGLIQAKDSSNLSFQVGGNVREVRVNQGDSVSAQQVLATLDRERYQLNVQAAEAEVVRARADLAQAAADYDRNQRLVAQRAVSQAQFEGARRNYEAAKSQIDFAAAQLDLARRDLRNTTLVAPFAGSIALRQIDPFVEVRAGQTVFRLDAAGGIEAAIGVPETTIGQIRIGMPASVTVPKFGEPMPAKITEIGSSASAANTFPVKLALLKPPAGVRPGMTAEVTLLLAQEVAAVSYFVPLSAIAPGGQLGTPSGAGPGPVPGEGFVFIFEPRSSTVRRAPVWPAGPVAGNRIAGPGHSGRDGGATAGVTFLVDGQKVRLLQPDLASSTR